MNTIKKIHFSLFLRITRSLIVRGGKIRIFFLFFFERLPAVVRDPLSVGLALLIYTAMKARRSNSSRACVRDGVENVSYIIKTI